jgi:hypothetical protein
VREGHPRKLSRFKKTDEELLLTPILPVSFVALAYARASDMFSSTAGLN